MFFVRMQDGAGRFGGGPWWALVLMGGMLVLGGILVLIVPQILVALVAGVIISAGAWLVSLGLALKPAGGVSYVTREDVVERRVPSGSARFEHVFGGQREHERW